MSDILWCPECRHWRPNEPSWLFGQRCEQCGTELVDDPPPLEVDFKEIDIGYEEGESEEQEDAQGDDAEAE